MAAVVDGGLLSRVVMRLSLYLEKITLAVVWTMHPRGSRAEAGD